SSGRDHYILASRDGISGGRRIARKRQRGLPQQLAAGFIEGAKFLVEAAGSDKQQSARGYNCASIIFCSRIRHAFRRERRILAEINLPYKLSRIQIDRVERAPGRSDRRVAV